jgi:hypothetical protein
MIIMGKKNNLKSNNEINLDNNDEINLKDNKISLDDNEINLEDNEISLKDNEISLDLDNNEISLENNDEINLEDNEINREINNINNPELIIDSDSIENDNSDYSNYNNNSFSTNTNHFNYIFDSGIVDSHLIQDPEIYNINNSKEEFHEDYSNVIPIRRLTLAFILSFGIYGYYWFYKNISYLKKYHNLPISIKFRTLAYIFLPIGNFIVLYDLINTMKPYIEQKGIKSYSPALNILGFMIFGFSFVGIWFYINVQESFNEYWRLEQNYLPIKRDFSNAEILIIFFVWLGILTLIAFFILTLKYKNIINI